MEVRVYSDLKDWNNNKSVLVVRVPNNPVFSFPYESCVRTFKSLFGQDCVVDFIVL